ncbi:MAG: hypothetical protein ABIO72_04175 [Patescibacteria group bacterium]
MKKLLLIIGAIAMVGAGCSSQGSTTVDPGVSGSVNVETQPSAPSGY